MNAKVHRMPSSVVRQNFSDALDQAQRTEVLIVRGSSDKGKPVAVLIGNERFNALTQAAARSETLLRELDDVTVKQLKVKSGDATMLQMQSKIRAALAVLRPKPQYTLEELLTRVPATGLAIDREFDGIKPAGREEL